MSDYKVLDPKSVKPRALIIKTELAATCGSALHRYNGNIPTMKAGDVLAMNFFTASKCRPERTGLYFLA